MALRMGDVRLLLGVLVISYYAALFFKGNTVLDE